MATIAEEEDQSNSDIKNKKKRKVGLGSSDAATIKRVIEAAQKGRIKYLQRRKAESPNEPLHMGLALLSKEQRKKIAAMGGAATKAAYGLSFYSEQGKIGGRTVVTRYSVEYMSDIAKKKKNRKNKPKKQKS